jgi:hypothetical protein
VNADKLRRMYKMKEGGGEGDNAEDVNHKLEKGRLYTAASRPPSRFEG